MQCSKVYLLAKRKSVDMHNDPDIVHPFKGIRAGGIQDVDRSYLLVSGRLPPPC